MLLGTILISLQPVDQKIVDWGIIVDHFPFIPGSDLSGEVVEVGEGVLNVKKGDHIITSPLHILGNEVQGAQEYAIAFGDLVAVVPENSNVSLEKAASIPCTFITAAIALAVNLNVKLPLPNAPRLSESEAEEPILVWGAGSNVGSNAVFLLTRAGYKNVYAVASERKRNQLNNVGATKFFDYNVPDVVENIINDLKNETQQSKFKKILDTVSLPNSLEPAIELADSNDAKIVVTLPPPESVQSHPGIKVEATWAGIPYNVDGKHPEARHLGSAIYSLIEDLLRDHQFPVNPRIQLVEDPDLLGGFNKVLDEYRVHGPKGGKVVLKVPTL